MSEQHPSKRSRSHGVSPEVSAFRANWAQQEGPRAVGARRVRMSAAEQRVRDALGDVAVPEGLVSRLRAKLAHADGSMFDQASRLPVGLAGRPDVSGTGASKAGTSAQSGESERTSPTALPASGSRWPRISLPRWRRRTWLAIALSAAIGGVILMVQWSQRPDASVLDLQQFANEAIRWIQRFGGDQFWRETPVATSRLC